MNAYMPHLTDPATELHTRALSINGRPFTAAVHNDPHGDGRHLVVVGAVGKEGLLFTQMPSGDIDAQVIIPGVTKVSPGEIAPPLGMIRILRSAETGEIEMKHPTGMTDEQICRVLTQQGFSKPGEEVTDMGRHLYDTFAQTIGHMDDAVGEYKASRSMRTAPGLVAGNVTSYACEERDLAETTRKFASAGLEEAPFNPRSLEAGALRMPMVSGEIVGKKPAGTIRITPTGKTCF